MRALVLVVVAALLCTPAAASYTAYWCRDSSCSLCDTYVFGEDVCESAPNDLTAVGICQSSTSGTYLYLRLWTTTGCSGTAYTSTHIPQGTCAYVSSIGNYNYMAPFCGSTAELAAIRNQSAVRKALPALPPNATREERQAPIVNRTTAR
eukprot:Hpha_TRINITY_DN15422_c0_g1::TRINITY_DN15422_c0_g1_i1::g.176799::m.176799